jgi:hypothetical protein
MTPCTGWDDPVHGFSTQLIRLYRYTSSSSDGMSSNSSGAGKGEADGCCETDPNVIVADRLVKVALAALVSA